MAETANVVSHSKGNRILNGEVLSNKMNKTIVVKVERTLRHPLLGKVIRRHKKYHVHDENSVAQVGDWVEIAETRPLSKTKYMTLVRVVEKQ
ncbi:MAG: 30S ribosomal protein S17 [candidate division TM6 bacterium GW2011_GWF2_38_10]|nr:MAG: 30S ribosomal protein S17 [candidate division TM6 bacterium GW2011_GWF2_38_10]